MGMLRSATLKTNPDISKTILTSLRRIIRAIDLHSRLLAQKYGLTGPQIIILQELQRKQNHTVGSLAHEVSLSPPTVTSILDRLEKKNLIARNRSVEDKRRVEITSTAAAENILQKKPPLMQENFQKKLNQLADWEQSLILSSLQRIAAMMQIEELDASPLLTTGSITETAETVLNLELNEEGAEGA